MKARRPMSLSVAKAVKKGQLTDADAGGIELAKHYADLIDDARDTGTYREVLADIGPKLLAALTALGLTPAGRATRKEGGPGVRANNPLTALRAEEDEVARKRAAKAVHAGAS